MTSSFGLLLCVLHWKWLSTSQSSAIISFYHEYSQWHGVNDTFLYPFVAITITELSVCWQKRNKIDKTLMFHQFKLPVINVTYTKKKSIIASACWSDLPHPHFQKHSPSFSPLVFCLCPWVSVAFVCVLR